jgi:hypothetical protein
VYSVEEVIQNINANATMVSLAGVWAMLVGYVQCIECIRLGFRDRTHAMPLVPLTFFLAHDTYYAVSYFLGHGVSDHWFFAAGGYVIAPFIALELVLAWQIINYSGAETGLGSTRRQAFISYVLVQVAMYAFFFFMRSFMNDPLDLTMTYVTLLPQTVFMIPLMLQRKSRKGQSILLAATLGFGQGLDMVLYYPQLADYYRSGVVISVAVAYFIVAMVYFVMVLRAPAYRASETRRLGPLPASHAPV